MSEAEPWGREAVIESLASSDVASEPDESSTSDDSSKTGRSVSPGSASRRKCRSIDELQERVGTLVRLLKERGIAVTDPAPDGGEDEASNHGSRKGKGAKEKRTLRGNTKSTKRAMKAGHREFLARLVAHYENLLQASTEAVQSGRGRKGRRDGKGKGKGKELPPPPRCGEASAVAEVADTISAESPRLDPAVQSQLDADMAMAMALSFEAAEADEVAERDRAFAVALAEEDGGGGGVEEQHGPVHSSVPSSGMQFHAPGMTPLELDPELRSLALAVELQAEEEAAHGRVAIEGEGGALRDLAAEQEWRVAAEEAIEAVEAIEALEASSAPVKAIDVSHGSELEDTGSIFQAHLAPCGTMQEVQAALREICADERCRRAACLPYAFRLSAMANGVTHADCDDGGEAGVGKRLAELLAAMGAVNVVVAVSRQVEGPMLGGRRFNHFLNVARELLARCGYDHRGQQPGRKKKTKPGTTRYGGRATATAGRFPDGSGGERERRQYLPTKHEAEYSRRHKEH